MRLPHWSMKAFGIVILLIIFIAACADVALETQTPTTSQSIILTEVPIIDLKITLRPSVTIAESELVALPTTAAGDRYYDSF